MSHTLKCRYYVRYCDDFLVLDRNPERLEEIREEVRSFLQQRLKLELNTRYAAITDLRDGIDFIGYIIRPDYVLVRRRSVNNLLIKLDSFQRQHVTTDSEELYTINPSPESIKRLQGVVASYYGHFKWGDSHRLRRTIFTRYPWLNAMFKMDKNLMPKMNTRFKRMIEIKKFSKHQEI